MFKAAIIGASGYSGEELIRILAAHPAISIDTVTSRRYAGQPLGQVFPRFRWLDTTFEAPDVEKIADSADIAFLALPHGLAAEFAVPLVKAGVKVVDISADFRLSDAAVYAEYYKTEHPAPGLLGTAVYGLPELHRDEVAGASMVACPGCYPTSVILPLAPLLRAGVISPKGILVASASGVTGAGRKLADAFLYPECAESFRAYAPSGHRHIPEMEMELSAAAGCEALVTFVPHLAPMRRGINSTMFLTPGPTFGKGAVGEALEDAYSNEPFVNVLPCGSTADTKHVTMTNTCEIGHVFDERSRQIIVTSAIDNLTKGASGQAVQCANIMLGLDESEGLI